MDGLLPWTICSIVTGGAVTGSGFVFLLCLVLALFLRWVTGVREPPAVVLVAAREIDGYLRRRLFPRAPKAAPEPAHTEPAVAACQFVSGVCISTLSMLLTSSG
jgi:hypothetical protein